MESYRSQWDEFAACCESPIESTLLAEMCFAIIGYGRLMLRPRLSSVFDGTDQEAMDGQTIIIPQAQIAGCRVDFAIYSGDLCGKWVMVAIECDGHDFHEKTKEQVARDKSRDRALSAWGVSTLRFTGSEIFKDARACALEISAVLETLVEQRLHLNGKVRATPRISQNLPSFNGGK